jgi:hypothetical protein
LSKVFDGFKQAKYSVLLNNKQAIQQTKLHPRIRYFMASPDKDKRTKYILTILSVYLQVLQRRYTFGKFTTKQVGIESINYGKEVIGLLKKNGMFTYTVIGFIFIFSGFLFIFSDLWLGIWATNLFEFSDPNMNLYIYATVALLAAFFVIFRDIVFRGR